MSETTDIIIIRGAPGSGKSQTAKSLSKYFPKGVRMEVDAIRKMVISVNWTNQQEHIEMLHASTKLVFEFLNLNLRPVIIIDTFSGDKILKYINTLYQFDKDISIKVFGLITTNDELKNRLELRKENEFKDFYVSKKINDDIKKFKYKAEQLIDTTGITSIETSDIIYKNLSQILEH